jgi:hypothetical protein
MPKSEPRRYLMEKRVGEEPVEPVSESSQSWPQVLRVSTPQNGTDVERRLNIWGWAVGTLQYDVATLPSWLIEVGSPRRQANLGLNTHEVVFRTAHLPPGVYRGSILIRGNVMNNPTAIPVEVTVTPVDRKPDDGNAPPVRRVAKAETELYW